MFKYIHLIISFVKILTTFVQVHFTVVTSHTHIVYGFFKHSFPVYVVLSNVYQYVLTSMGYSVLLQEKDTETPGCF